MPSPVDSYANGILHAFRQYAAWPPNTTIRVGDIGILEGNLFRYRSTLETMRIHFDERPVSPAADLDGSSGSNIELNIGAGGQAIPAGGARARISSDFKRRVRFAGDGVPFTRDRGQD